MNCEQETDEAITLAIYMAENLEALIIEIRPTSIVGVEAKDIWLAEPYNAERFGVKKEQSDNLQSTMDAPIQNTLN